MSLDITEEQLDKVDTSEEIPVNQLLDDLVTDEEIQFMNSDEATLDNIGDILEIINNKEIKRLAFGTKKKPGLLKFEINTLTKARQENEEVIFTPYVLERVCSVIGRKVRKCLEELYIQCLPISLWAYSLTTNHARYLKKLSLRHCRLEDYGCKAIFNQISPTVTHIDLTDNGITKRGVYSIVDEIREQNANKVVKPNSSSLLYLCLNCNPIRSGGLAILVDILVNDFCVKAVELRNCEIDDIGEAYVLAMINNVLEVFDLRANPVDNVNTINEVTKLIIQNNPQETATFKWSTAEKLMMQ